jgi:hypothetical protein
VRSGTHWVLITNYTSNPDTWVVNDPYFPQTTYQYNTMSHFVVYNAGHYSKIEEPVVDEPVVVDQVCTP